MMAKPAGRGALHEVAGRKVVRAADYLAREVKNTDTAARCEDRDRACPRSDVLTYHGWTDGRSA